MTVYPSSRPNTDTILSCHNIIVLYLQPCNYSAIALEDKMNCSNVVEFQISFRKSKKRLCAESKSYLSLNILDDQMRSRLITSLIEGYYSSGAEIYYLDT